jgi:hypothetical protein
VIVIQPRSEAAVQEQWLAVVTVTELGPPAAPNESEDEDRLYVQGPGVGSIGESLPQAAAIPIARIEARDETNFLRMVTSVLQVRQ